MNGQFNMDPLKCNLATWSAEDGTHHKDITTSQTMGTAPLTQMLPWKGELSLSSSSVSVRKRWWMIIGREKGQEKTAAYVMAINYKHEQSEFSKRSETIS